MNTHSTNVRRDPGRTQAPRALFKIIVILADENSKTQFPNQFRFVYVDGAILPTAAFRHL